MCRLLKHVLSCPGGYRVIVCALLPRGLSRGIRGRHSTSPWCVRHFECLQACTSAAQSIGVLATEGRGASTTCLDCFRCSAAIRPTRTKTSTVSTCASSTAPQMCTKTTPALCELCPVKCAQRPHRRCVSYALSHKCAQRQTGTV